MTFEIKQLPARKDVLEEDKWNVEALFSSLEEWERQFQSAYKESDSPHWPNLAAFQGKLQESPETLASALEAFLDIGRQLEKFYTYAHLRHDEEITLDQEKSAFQRASLALHAFGEECAWFEPELLALPEETFTNFLESEPLAPFRFHLEKIRRLAPHTLSSDKEELLAMAAKPLELSGRAFSAMNNADLTFPPVQDSEGNEHPLSHGTYQLFLRSFDRGLRESAFKALHQSFMGMENSLAELLQGKVQSHLFQARARNYSSCVEAALYPKNIPVAVYKSLIHAVRNGLPSLHRYVSIRKKVMQVDTLHLYDMYVPLVQDFDFSHTFEEAERLVISSVAPLGDHYQESLAKGLSKERWVDRFENENKRSGAYSSGCYDSFPYILMNFRGTLRDTFTLAHEAGHSMHSLLSRNTQPYHYAHYPIFVAEVASTFNEELLLHLLLQETQDPRMRLFLINEKIEDLRATLFRQTMFAEFELMIHELAEQGVPLTPSLLKEKYFALNQDYFGSSAHIDEEISIEWSRIPHFYYNFYVYQYATGISAAFSLAERVLAGDQSSVDSYLRFLSSGCSNYPIALLQEAGIDMTSPTPVEKTIQKFDSLLGELESLAL